MSTATVSPNQALWEKGDFSRIAGSMRESGEALVRKLGIGTGMRILDLGCGDGNTALPAAHAGAEVLGVDISRNLVEAATRRAQAAGLTNITIQHGDAMNLAGIADHSFDRAISIFGAMFAPRPFDVAKEMVRVTRPGGKVIMGNWIPNDPTLVAQILRISSAYTPPPPEGFISPMTWGIESHVVERFGAAGIAADRIACHKDSFVFRYAGTPQAYVQEFKNYYGPTMNAFEAAATNGRDAELQKELEELFASHNTSAQGTTIAANFMRVEVSC